MHISLFRKVKILLCIFLLFSGCSVQKQIPENKLLLKKVTITNAPDDYEDDLREQIRQMPRRRMFGLSNPFLYIYMKTDQKKPTKFNKAIQKYFGEKPVYVDTAEVRESAEKMKSFMINKGYMHSGVSFSMNKKKKIAKLDYNINPGERFVINKVVYTIADSNLRKVVENQKRESKITENAYYDSDDLINEREQLAFSLNDLGYYKFNKYFIYFDVDTSLAHAGKVNIQVVVRNFSDTSNHKLFKINDIIIDPNYNILDTVAKDTFLISGIKFLGQNYVLKPPLFLKNLKIRKGDLYSLENQKQTINNFSELQVFKFIDVDFRELPVTGNDTALLDCYIRLTPHKKQGFVYETELNTTEENKYLTGTVNRYYGMAGGLTYKNRNVFKQAAEWTVSFSGAFDLQSGVFRGQGLSGNYQMEANTSLLFPTAFLPVSLLDKIPSKSSKTALSLAYYYEDNLDFRRNTSNFSTIYQFNNKYSKHFFTPFEISRVQSEITDSLFKVRLRDINDVLLNSTFETHIITALKYAIAFNNQGKSKKHYWRVKWNVFEGAGNLPRLLSRLIDDQKSDTVYQIFNVDFYQFFKTDLDVSYNYLINPWSSFAARLSVGLGVPFGNSTILPFEKRYFMGGANSMRAWKLRGLGPGSYNQSSLLRFERSGEFKLENNYEYRFDLFSFVKGAVFLDMGNIWTLKPEESRPGGEFRFDKFLPEVAVGTGFGLRFDFVYVIIRTDFGIPVHDPAQPVGKRWVIQETDLNDINFNLGIGYPF